MEENTNIKLKVNDLFIVVRSWRVVIVHYFIQNDVLYNFFIIMIFSVNHNVGNCLIDFIDIKSHYQVFCSLDYVKEH